MNRVLKHKMPSDSLRLLANKLVVNCGSDSIFIWWLSFKDTEQILGSRGMGWGGMVCLLQVVAGTERDLGQIISIARPPFPRICSLVPPEHCYSCTWKPCCWLWAPSSLPEGGFSPKWGRAACGRVLGVSCSLLMGLCASVGLAWLVRMERSLPFSEMCCSILHSHW